MDVKALRLYALGHTLSVRSTAQDVVVTISVEGDGESLDTTDDGSSWLSSLIGLRADIAGGDERALYLAWLLDVQCGVITDNTVEPARPEGLENLSPALAPPVMSMLGCSRELLAVTAVWDPRSGACFGGTRHTARSPFRRARPASSGAGSSDRGKATQGGSSA